MCEYVNAHYLASVGVFLYTIHSHDYMQTVITGGGRRVESRGKKTKSNKIEIDKIIEINQIKKNKTVGKREKRMARRMKQIDGES